MSLRSFLRTGAWYQTQSGKALSSDLEITDIVDNANPTDPIVDDEAILPDQVGNSGKFLTTDGATPSWGTPSGGGGLTYLVYTALLSQSGTNAPVATVKPNTLGGTVVWSYGDVGYYQATLAGAFPSGRTFCFITPSNQNTDIAVDIEDGVPNSIAVYTTVDGVPTDGRLSNASIRIEVYPT